VTSAYLDLSAVYRNRSKSNLGAQSALMENGSTANFTVLP